MKIYPYVLILLLVLALVACDNQIEEPGEVMTSEETPTGQSQAETTGSETAEVPLPTEAPSEEIDGEPARAPNGPQDVTIEGAEGLAIQGTFYPGSGDGPRPGVLLLHMNGRNRGDWDIFARQLADNGYAALAVDMRGHGQTGGGRDWDLAANDLRQVWLALTEREEVNGSRGAIIGASIGANMALVTALDEPAVRTVVLLSPGRDYFGVTTEDRIVAYGQRPALIVASEEDSEAAESSRALEELAQNAELIMYDGTGHGTSMFGPRPELADEIITWLGQHIDSGEATTGNGDSTGSASTLLDVNWDDRSPFRSGLIAAEAGTLQQTPGASVYHMDLAIASDLQSVIGRQEVRYTNQEDVPLEELYFHLYPNLLGGGITISEVTVDGQPVEPVYRAQNTVMGVPLPAALAPGERSVIAVGYEVAVPTEGGSNYGVFATKDGVLALAHFYPQVAVYNDDGWQIEVPPPNADVTHSDASYYLARITAPADQVLVTSGNQIERTTTGDEQTVLVAAGPVRDFYLASSDRYTVVSQQVGETMINSYGFPEFSMQNKQALSYAAGAIKSLGSRLGTYPYTEFDIAPTPNLALGVEYPGAVVIRSELYDPNLMFGEQPANAYMESTIAHEVGHQWFYNTVGNDQLDEPWLDESLTQYVTYLYFLDAYGEQAAAGFRESLLGRWDRVNMADIPIGMPASNYDGTEYSAIVYGRGPLFFEKLAEEIGQEVFDAFLRDYYQQNKWGIASRADLKALAEQHCGCDLTQLFVDWVGEQ